MAIRLDAEREVFLPGVFLLCVGRGTVVQLANQFLSAFRHRQGSLFLDIRHS